MFNLFKFIICLQCVILLKGVDDSNELPPILRNPNYPRRNNCPPISENEEKDYLDKMPNYCVPENFYRINRIIVRINKFYDHLCDSIEKINNIYVRPLDSIYRIEKVKAELSSLKADYIKRYVKEIGIIAYHSYGTSSYQQSMVWNRISLAKEVFHELLNKELPAKEPLQNAYAQLLRIKKEHLDFSLKNYKPYDSYYYDDTKCNALQEYQPWQEKKWTISFVELIENIFALLASPSNQSVL